MTVTDSDSAQVISSDEKKEPEKSEAPVKTDETPEKEDGKCEAPVKTDKAPVKTDKTPEK